MSMISSAIRNLIRDRTQRQSRSGEDIVYGSVNLPGHQGVTAIRVSERVWEFTCPDCGRNNKVTDLSDVTKCKFNHTQQP